MSEADTLVYDMANMSQAQPSIFVAKQWVSILDEQNGSYSGGQSILSTSAISNSSKYASFREGYLQVPLITTLTSTLADNTGFQPDDGTDFVYGLKNNIASIIDSLTLDVNNVTLIQMSKMIGVYNNFKLLTSLNWNDVKGGLCSSYGFYPDNAKSLAFVDSSTASESGFGVSNSVNGLSFPVSTLKNVQDVANEGLLRRQQALHYNPDAATSTTTSAVNYSALLSESNAKSLYRSYVSTRQGAGGALMSGKGIHQVSITGIIPLRNLADFFQKIPLCKGLYLRMVLGLSNSSCSFTIASDKYSAATINNPLGGVFPIQLASTLAGSGAAVLPDDSYVVSVAVGNKVLESAQAGAPDGTLATGITLNVPVYTFQSVYESQYISNQVKKIAYDDVYQYQISNIASGQNVNQIVTSGLAGAKDLVMVPYFNKSAAGNCAGFDDLNSPFSSTGCGTMGSPLAFVSQFQVSHAGANIFYQTLKYNYQSYLEHFYGVNSINAGLIDGVGGSLYDQTTWDMSPVYYAKLDRALPIEKDIPKSLSLQFTNLSARTCSYLVFITYQQEIMIDILTGSKI
jgi:hypothetical protein